MNELVEMGWGPFFQNQLVERKPGFGIPARVAAEHRGAYEVWTITGSGTAELAGRLARELENGTLPGVGDWVSLKSEPDSNHKAIIDGVFERRTVFTRGAAGRRTKTQVVAANVDLVFAVSGLDADFNVRRIERYLARIWASGADPAIILNKSDLCEDVEMKVFEVAGSCPGVPVLLASASRSEGIDAIREMIEQGLTAAFVGSSGVGKSTIVNALLGEKRMKTGEVRERDGRGCHITTARQLFMLPGGGLLLDTPGMRELELADDDGLDMVFADIELLADQCRYRDCGHEIEPGCAVKQAVEMGELSEERLEHYRKLKSEARAFELRSNEHLRRKSQRVWGQLYEEAKRIRRWKGED